MGYGRVMGGLWDYFRAHIQLCNRMWLQQIVHKKANID